MRRVSGRQAIVKQHREANPRFICNWQAVIMINADSTPRAVSTLANTTASGAAAPLMTSLIAAGFLQVHSGKAHLRYSITDAGESFKQLLLSLKQASESLSDSKESQ